jgi:TP901 family phage tail tape measure protein
MSRKVYEISFNIAGRLASTFKGAFASASSQIRNLGNDVKSLKGGIRNLEEEYKKGAVSVQAYQAAHQRLSAQLARTLQIQQQLSQTQQRQNELHQQASQIRSQMLDTAVMATPFIASARAAMQFEDAMLGVARQVQGARDESGKLTPIYYDMARQIQQLGREIPLATNEIADMVTAGARMGVARAELVKFTRTAAMMATAFDTVPGEIAESMGKVATNFKIPITQINELADSINYLDDNAISKGSEIINVLNRISGVVSTVKMSSKDAAALASTLLTLGDTPETASTAINAITQKFAAAEKGTKKFQAAIKQIGLSSAEVQKGMATDATGTMLKVFEGIKKLPKDDRIGVMVDLVGLEHSDTLAKLADKTEEFRKQLALANGEAAKGAMSREFAARLQTSSAQMQLLKNSMTETAVAMGNVLLPGLNSIFKSLSQAAQGASEFAEKYPALTKAIVMGTTAVIGARIAWLGLRFAWTQAELMGNGLKLVITRVTAAQTLATTRMVLASTVTKTMTAAQWAWNVALNANPIGLVITGIAALVAGGIYLYKNWDTVKEKALQLWETLKNNPMLGLVAGPFGALVTAGVTLYNNWDRLKQGAMDIGIAVSNYFKGMANGIIQSVNRIIAGINNLTGTSIPQLQELQLDYSVQVRKMNEMRMARNYDIDGSHANGLSYVPYNGYIAELHKGERVLTARENKEYSGGATWTNLGRSMGGDIRIEINAPFNPVIKGSGADMLPALEKQHRDYIEHLRAIVRDEVSAIARQRRRVAFQ